MKKWILAGFAATTLAAGPVANAVSLAEQSPGQVLLYPYYDARNNSNTLFQFTNGSAEFGVVSKVILRESLNGRATLSFAAYLGPGETFAASLGEIEGGVPALKFSGDGCTVPQTEAGFSVPLRGVDYQDDGGPNEISRAAEGYIEVFETARFNPGDFSECAEFDQRWNGVWRDDPTQGLLPPGNDLSGQLIWVDVVAGVAREIDTVGLRDFNTEIFGEIFDPIEGSDAVASNLRPTLADVSPAVSRVVENGAVIESNWSAHPVDAVSALVMSDRLSAAYFNDSEIGAESVFHAFMPTKRFYTDAAISAQPRAPFPSNAFSDGSCSLQPEIIVRARSGEETPLAAEGLCLENALSSVGPDNVPTNGWLDIAINGDEQVLISDEGHLYRGLPLVGAVWQRFVNGDVGGVRANYATHHQADQTRTILLD